MRWGWDGTGQGGTGRGGKDEDGVNGHACTWKDEMDEWMDGCMHEMGLEWGWGPDRTGPDRTGRDGTERNGMRWDGTGRDGMGWDGPSVMLA